MKLLYIVVISQKCNLEKQALKNSLSIATQAPDEFAFDLMKGPGYMVVVAGEVVRFVKCVPVDVKIEHGDSCYAELQVTRNDKTYFLKGTFPSRGLKKSCFSFCLIDQASIEDYVCKILARNSKYFGRCTEIQSVTYITKSKARFLKTMFLQFAVNITKKVLNRFS